MPRSLAGGDYSLLMAVESSSRPSSWYRVLVDRQSRLLSCDCPPWTFNRQEDDQGHRSCSPTAIGNQLVVGNPTVQPRLAPPVSTNHPLLAATQTQWPGLRGVWSIEERDANIGTKSYHFVLLRLALGNGGTATGVVAFANTYHHTQDEMIPGVAGWAGYAIAAEVARLAGHPFMGQVPEHFRIDRRPTTRQRQRPTPTTAPRPMPSIGLTDILRVGDIVRPGTDPRLIAEQTLELFLGGTLYQQLERQHFLDISSVRYSGEQRVYRLRRDPYKERERRVRTFRNREYWKDFCIIRDNPNNYPEADFFLTNFLMFLSDENIALSVVQSYNVFSPYSDGDERETMPAVWHPRITALTA